MGTGIKGFKSQKMLKSKLSGYTENESIDIERYATIQELTGDKHGVDTVIHGVYKVNPLPLTAAAGSNIRTIKCVAHGAVKGDQIRFILSGIEASVLSTPDADTIILGSELASSPVGLDFNVLKHITPLYGSDGSLSVSSGPVSFNRTSSGSTSVTQALDDLDTPSNSRPLPSGMFIKKDDGNYYPVTLDTTNPYNHTPIPVAITDVTGTANVNITAGDLNVSIKHNGVDPSSVRVGDGTNLVGVTASNEAKVIDSNAATKLDTLHTDLTSTNTKLDTIHTDLGLVSTSANQTNGNQITKIKSGSNGNVLDVLTLGTNPVAGDKGLIAQAILHTKNGANYLDVPGDAAGRIQIDLSGTSANATAIKVDGSASTQPVSGTVAVSNLPTTVDTNSGAAGASTLRSVLATRHETNTTPLALRESDGTNWLSSIALAAAQLTSGALTAIKMGASIMMGWDGTTHREIAVTTGGAFKTSSVVKSGTITTTQLSVGLVAVRSTVSGSAPSANRMKLWIKPSKNNTGAIYIGSSGVTISTGVEIIGPDRWEVLDDSNDWYLISDTAGQVVEILEVA